MRLEWQRCGTCVASLQEGDLTKDSARVSTCRSAQVRNVRRATCDVLAGRGATWHGADRVALCTLHFARWTLHVGRERQRLCTRTLCTLQPWRHIPVARTHSHLNLGEHLKPMSELSDYKVEPGDPDS